MKMRTRYFSGWTVLAFCSPLDPSCSTHFPRQVTCICLCSAWHVKSLSDQCTVCTVLDFIWLSMIYMCCTCDLRYWIGVRLSSCHQSATSATTCLQSTTHWYSKVLLSLLLTSRNLIKAVPIKAVQICTSIYRICTLHNELHHIIVTCYIICIEQLAQARTQVFIWSVTRVGPDLVLDSVCFVWDSVWMIFCFI